MNSQDPFLEKTNLFEARKGGYLAYRIPATVVTKHGTVLAFSEGRREGTSDWDPTDVLLRRSTNGGSTWSKRQLVIEAGGDLVHSPLPIVDHMTGAVHLLYAWWTKEGYVKYFDSSQTRTLYSRFFYMRSDDDGKTFTDPVDITSVFEAYRGEYDWNLLCPDPNHGIQLKNGRLIAPVWLATGGHAQRPSCVSVIYSDDHGKTWHRGDIVVRHSEITPNPSESVAVQLHDDRVMLNIRTESKKNLRLVSFSADGAKNWSKPVFDEEVFEPICNASVLRLTEQPEHNKNRILFSNPDSRNSPKGPNEWGARPRENITIKMSYDEGQTWPVSKVLDPGIGGYTDLAVGLDGSTIYCLYERGGVKGNMFDNSYITVARFNIEWLTDGKDSFEK